jgi:anti-anti-sigma factor
MSADDLKRVIVIDIEGVLNNETARALEANIDSLLAQGKRSLILNGKNLSYVTSRGISALILGIKKIKDSGGNAAIVELNKEVETLFSILQISKFLNIFPTRQDAVDSFKETIFPHTNQPSFSEEPVPEFIPDEEHSKIAIEEQYDNDFDSPIIIECSNCGALVRSYRPGDYICPSCKTQFTVNRDGTAVF